ncbi:MAG TPA: GNAT family protein [Burkholderiaceae bacterium]
MRPMKLDEIDFVIDYFHCASAEHLEMLGIDPARLPDREMWRTLNVHDFSLLLPQRRSFVLLWELEGRPIGFSTVDKIKFGEHAYMHLHVVDVNLRQSGYGTSCVRKSVEIYFDLLKLERLYCEPNAFNVAPNRALQKAGFRYVKTHMTVPGPINFHQAVNRWVIERDSADAPNK